MFGNETFQNDSLRVRTHLWCRGRCSTSPAEGSGRSVESFAVPVCREPRAGEGMKALLKKSMSDRRSSATPAPPASSSMAALADLAKTEQSASRRLGQAQGRLGSLLDAAREEVETAIVVLGASGDLPTWRSGPPPDLVPPVAVRIG